MSIFKILSDQLKTTLQNAEDKTENSSGMRKPELIFLLITAIILLSIFVFYKYRARELDKNGVYVIGKVVSVESVENGYNATISYRFNSKKYEFTQKTLPAIKEPFVFLLVSKDKPRICSLLNELKVPLCLTTKDHIDSSWNIIPHCQ